MVIANEPSPPLSGNIHQSAAVDLAGIPRERVATQRVATNWRARLRRAWPIIIIAVAFIVPLLILPPTYGHPLIDDWNYQLSVSHLLHQHQLWVAPWTATTLLLQIFWGTLFAWPFGLSATALRMSTLVACFLGTIACYGLFRELEISRNRALVGALAVWLNPMTFSLSYTFMTDVPFLALLAGSVYLLVRSVRRESYWAMVGASALAGGAFLVRQQGILIPIAVFIWLLISPPDWMRRHPYRVSATLLGPALLCVQEYYFWIWIRGVPQTQSAYLSDVRHAGPWGLLIIGTKILFVAIFYAGFFIFPFVLASVRSLPAAWRRSSITARGGIGIGLACLLIWTRWYYMSHDGRSFPFVPWGSMFHEDGLGVLDSIGLRTFFGPHWAWAAGAVICAFSAALGTLLFCGRERAPIPRTRPGELAPVTPWLIGLIGAVTVGQFVGIIPPSVHIRQYITFDRYFLPLIPLLLALLLWGLRGQRLAIPVASAILVIAVAAGLLGVQDWLAFKQDQWNTAVWLSTQKGVPLRELDAGPQWDGMHFYEASLAQPTDRAPRQPNDVWWLFLIAPQIDPVYQLSASPIPPNGYVLYAKRPYHSWIRLAKDSYVYVFRRTVTPVTTAQPLPPSAPTSGVAANPNSPLPATAMVISTPPTPAPAPAFQRQHDGDPRAGPQ